jgi:hypothetical protein
MSADNTFSNNQAKSLGFRLTDPLGSGGGGGALGLRCISRCKCAFNSSSEAPLLPHLLSIRNVNLIKLIDVFHADNTYSSNYASSGGGAAGVVVQDGSMMTLRSSGITILHTC